MIIIKADTNDADYVHSIIEDEWYIKEENLDRFKKIATIVKERTKVGTHNWENGDSITMAPEEMYEGVLTEDDIDFFEEYLPYGEYGIHTIKSIRIISTGPEEVII